MRIERYDIPQETKSLHHQLLVVTTIALRRR
jgi:hypothetical protein